MYVADRAPGQGAPSRGEGRLQELFIFARFHAREGQEGAVAEALSSTVESSRNDPGCMAIQAYRSTLDPRLFYIHSRWADEGSFEAHILLPHTIRFAERVEPLIDHELKVTRTRILQSSG
ncbi:MAG: antibiotic biosynthesis monooxygenase [Thaumarchaeota archaeon]|nr:antibiotic biosynthesis monooxygenase [Nitrososphaerota archaeon]